MADLTHWDVIVVGGANTDYLVRGSRLPQPGEKIEGDVFQGAIGGKGVNQAVAASSGVSEMTIEVTRSLTN